MWRTDNEQQRMNMIVSRVMNDNSPTFVVKQEYNERDDSDRCLGLVSGQVVQFVDE